MADRTGAAPLVTDQPPQQLVDADICQCLAVSQYHEAFERLVERYSAKVFHLAYSMIGNETQAEDVAQEVLLRIWKGLPGYHAGASLSTWIYTIARNTCLTELKRRARHPTVSMDEPGFAAAMDSVPALQSRDPESGLELDVRQMLSQLPEKYRQAITLFYLEQKSYEMVAALLGVPLGTVKTFLYRAKKELLKIYSRRAPAPGASRYCHHDFGVAPSPPLEERVGERRPRISNPTKPTEPLAHTQTPLPDPLPASGERETPSNAPWQCQDAPARPGPAL